MYTRDKMLNVSKISGLIRHHRREQSQQPLVQARKPRLCEQPGHCKRGAIEGKFERRYSPPDQVTPFHF